MLKVLFPLSFFPLTVTVVNRTYQCEVIHLLVKCSVVRSVINKCYQIKSSYFLPIRQRLFKINNLEIGAAQ